jgi:D-3-phosphoglycerate dehydrogenase
MSASAVPRRRVLVTTRTFQKMEGAHWDALREAGLEAVSSGLDRTLDERELAERLPGIAALICGMDAVSERALEAAGELRVISMNGVGLDRIDVEAATRRGIVVTRTPGSNADSVADLALALMLAQARQIPRHERGLRQGDFRRRPGRELRGRRLGLVGLGAIGKEVALRALAFGMAVQACDPCADLDFCRKHGIEVADWETTLRSSDILSLHLPVTEETMGLIDRRALAAMKPGAVLINTARGELVDEAALVEALGSGHLGGAGLDVFSPEPPAPGPLLEMEQVVLTPHLGGNTREAALRTALRAARNAVAILAGKVGEADSIANPEVLNASEGDR